MSGTPENQQPPAPQQDARPQRWPVALDVALDCLLFILLQYMVSCVTLSFLDAPLRLAAISSSLGCTPIFHDMDKRLGKFWPGLVLSVVCVGVVVALVGLVGYFPNGGGAGASALGWPDTAAESFTLYFFFLLSLLLSTRRSFTYDKSTSWHHRRGQYGFRPRCQYPGGQVPRD